MGRRSINTTKSGKYMNPTDQARKEARKRELKKNKKQRMMVRQAVLKGKDPFKLLEDVESIDKMEFDPALPPKLNEKVLRDKRKKLKETLDRVLKLYEKEDPEYAVELRKAILEQERKRVQMQIYYEQVKTAERVQLDQIPLPDAPVATPTIPSQIPLPSDVPLPLGMTIPAHKPIHGILKKQHNSMMGLRPSVVLKRQPPAPPPGPPPPLSDSEDEQDPVAPPRMEDMTSVPPPSKLRKIRFEDDPSRDLGAEEKDTRLKLKPAVSALQVRMLQMAKMEVPMVAEQAQAQLQRQERRKRKSRFATSDSESDDDDAAMATGAPGHDDEKRTKLGEPSAPTGGLQAPPGPPPGLPPGLPPGPPPGLPPMMMRPPPLRGAQPGGAPPRMLPPGPPPGRPPGIPPGPPPGLPPNLRGPPPRLPPGPPGMGPPRLMRPPGAPPGIPPPGVPPPGAGSATVPPGAGVPGVLSAPPSISKPPTKSGGMLGGPPGGVGAVEKKRGATIEAKPQIKNVMGDVTRFTPTALKVKRVQKDAKGRVIKNTDKDLPPSMKPTPNVHAQTKDDAYDVFMKEMENFL